MPRKYPGSTPGVDPRSQGVIPRQFKQKKNFVTNGRTHEPTVSENEYHALGLFPIKTAFFKWVWWKVKVLSRP